MGGIATSAAWSESDFDASRRPYADGLTLVGQAALDAASVHAQLTAVVPQTFTATVWANRLGAVRLTHFRGSALVSRRRGDRLTDHYARLLQVGVIARGTATVRQSGRTLTAGPGMAVVVRQDVEFHIENSDDYVVTHAYLDPRRVRAWGFGDDVLATGAWALGAPGHAAAAILESASRCGVGTATPTTRHLALAVAHASMVVLAERSGAPATPVTSATELLRLRLLSAIDARFDEPGLSADVLADELDVSRRYVYRAFEGLGISIAALIRERRLDHAGDLLLTVGPPMSVAEVATACGFASVQAFSRAFRARFGRTPSEYRGVAHRAE